MLQYRKNQHGQVIAERTSGTYQYGRLMIDIAQNGTETRICASDPSHALSATKQREFCSMVETAGYIQGMITGGGDPIWDRDPQKNLSPKGEVFLYTIFFICSFISFSYNIF